MAKRKFKIKKEHKLKVKLKKERKEEKITKINYEIL